MGGIQPRPGGYQGGSTARARRGPGIYEERLLGVAHGEKNQERKEGTDGAASMRIEGGFWLSGPK